MILNFDILEYLKVYATKACDEYFDCSFIQALHFHTSKKLAINISKSTYSPVSKLQVTMVIDMNEEVEKSSGPAKLTDEVMGIMCRWF